MKEFAINQILEELNRRNVPLHGMKALDFFAREGDWQTMHYAQHVKQVYAWEIDPAFEDGLRKNLPNNASITIGDSFETLKTTQEKFDLIVLDNPQGCFGGKYCEHFEALPQSLHLLPEEGLVIFNFKSEPFNYEEKVDWQKRRNDFYGKDATRLDVQFAKEFYEKFFLERKLKTEFSFFVIRPQESGLYACVSKLKRVES